MKVKVYIEEAGCNRRKLDVNKIRAYLGINDYELVDRPEDADKILVTTCAFKKKEEDESVQRLRYFRDYGPNVVVYGCLPDIAAERYKEFSDIPKVAPKEIEKIEQYFPGTVKRFYDVADSNCIEKSGENVFQSIVRVIQTQPIIDREFMHRTIAAGRKKIEEYLTPTETPFYLFVCRGCLGICSYCAIKKSIGSVQSKPIAAIISEFNQGVADGYRKFTILGDDPGCYGIDLKSTLPELLEALLEAGAERKKNPEKGETAEADISFTINEIHPKYLISYSKKFMAMERFSSIRSILCPVQSGSSRILESMKREHTAEQFEEAVKTMYSHHPQLEFNTQIIVGFPSETDEEFHETLNLVARCKFSSVVIFPYDDKQRIASSFLSEKIPAKVIQKRMRAAFHYFRTAGVKAYYKCP